MVDKPVLGSVVLIGQAMVAFLLSLRVRSGTSSIGCGGDNETGEIEMGYADTARASTEHSIDSNVLRPDFVVYFASRRSVSAE